MTYLLDTDTTILMMRGLKIQSPSNQKQRERQARGHKILRQCRKQAQGDHVVALSAISVAELEYGACKANDPIRERQTMRLVLAPFQALDFDAQHAAASYGEIRAMLEANGALIGPNDMLIAAHALSIGATLITNNTAEFKRVKGLVVRNWS